MIEVRDVDKSFGDPPIWALQGIRLTVQDGEFVTVVGPSGCGKTTLLNLIAGFEFPSAGQLLVNGAPIERP
ncbi:MAG: ATP-binding cassette domain-containing protein, partial [Sulfobacillus sp.]|nr:ATP-binding cassette domain-containing protein [Sulfobacillus sp.]